MLDRVRAVTGTGSSSKLPVQSLTCMFMAAHMTECFDDQAVPNLSDFVQSVEYVESVYQLSMEQLNIMKLLNGKLPSRSAFDYLMIYLVRLKMRQECNAIFNVLINAKVPIPQTASTTPPTPSHNMLYRLAPSNNISPSTPFSQLDGLTFCFLQCSVVISVMVRRGEYVATQSPGAIAAAVFKTVVNEFLSQHGARMASMAKLPFNPPPLSNNNNNSSSTSNLPPLHTFPYATSCAADYFPHANNNNNNNNINNNNINQGVNQNSHWLNGLVSSQHQQFIAIQQSNSHQNSSSTLEQSCASVSSTSNSSSSQTNGSVLIPQPVHNERISSWCAPPLAVSRVSSTFSSSTSLNINNNNNNNNNVDVVHTANNLMFNNNISGTFCGNKDISSEDEDVAFDEVDLAMDIEEVYVNQNISSMQSLISTHNKPSNNIINLNNNNNNYINTASLYPSAASSSSSLFPNADSQNIISTCISASNNAMMANPNNSNIVTCATPRNPHYQQQQQNIHSAISQLSTACATPLTSNTPVHGRPLVSIPDSVLHKVILSNVPDLVAAVSSHDICTSVHSCLTSLRCKSEFLNDLSLVAERAGAKLVKGAKPGSKESIRALRELCFHKHSLGNLPAESAN